VREWNCPFGVQVFSHKRSIPINQDFSQNLLISINLNVFFIAIELLQTKDLDSGRFKA